MRSPRFVPAAVLTIAISAAAGGLFGGAVANLGTADHHAAYLGRILDASLPGCFAMTETGHGSDVQSLGTTATYDPATDELVVHTPDVASRRSSSSRRRIRMAASISGAKKRWQLRPAALAWYSAMSAFFISVSGSAPSLGATAMPMLAPMMM